MQFINENLCKQHIYSWCKHPNPKKQLVPNPVKFVQQNYLAKVKKKKKKAQCGPQFSLILKYLQFMMSFE